MASDHLMKKNNFCVMLMQFGIAVLFLLFGLLNHHYIISSGME